jgi:hypothetical protein
VEQQRGRCSTCKGTPKGVPLGRKWSSPSVRLLGWSKTPFWRGAVMLQVTSHAVSRYRRRVEPVSYDEVVRRLTTPAIVSAAAIGAASVLLPSGHKVVLIGNRVVTVKAKSSKKRRFRC